MIFRGILTSAAALSLLLLAGCGTGDGGGGIGVDPDPFPNESEQDLTVQPTFDSDPVRQNVTLGAGQSIVYRVDISASVASNNDVVYFDALPVAGGGGGAALEVTAYRVNGSQATPILVSTSREWFGRPADPGLAALSGNIEPSTIDNTTNACGGPCLVVPTPDSAGTAYFRVTAQQSVTYDLYVVATDLADVGEPNDSPGTAETVVISGSTSVVGATELIGDTDWYVSSQSVSSVAFEANNQLRLRARVYDATDGSPLGLLRDNDSLTVSPPRVVRVEVYSDEDQERAAAAGMALYTLIFD